MGLKNDKPIDVINYVKIINFFPNAYITYKIMLTSISCFGPNEFFKIKDNKNLFKINNVSTKIKQIGVIYKKINVK